MPFVKVLTIISSYISFYSFTSIKRKTNKYEVNSSFLNLIDSSHDNTEIAIGNLAMNFSEWVD